jgi:hypothetical protein
MPTAHPVLDDTDRTLARLSRDWFERDLRERIDTGIEQQVAIFLAGELSRRELCEAA